MRSFVVLFLVAPLALAGCVTFEDPVSPTTVVDRFPENILPYLDLSDEHDHANPDQHRAAWNVELVAHHYLTPTDTPADLGRYNQLQVRDGYAYVSAYNVPDEGGAPGLIVVDVRDPANPAVVGTVATPDGTPIDVWLTEDGRYALVAGHRDRNLQLPNPVQQGCTSAPGTSMTLCPPFVWDGVTAINVEDKANPRVVAHYRMAPSGAHTVKTHEIDGETYVFAANYGVYSVDRKLSGVDILRLVKNDDGSASFEEAGRWLFNPLGSGGRTFVHDMWVEDNEQLGKPLMYVAYWDGGVALVDVSDPANPVDVANWNDFDADEYGNIHFVRPLPAAVGGKHVTVAAPEFGSAEHAGMLWTIDTSDVTQPATLGTWHLPGDPVSDSGYRYSPHNFDPRADGTLVYGHYHAGVWVMDVGSEGTVEKPRVLGYFFTAPPEEKAEGLDLGEDVVRVWNAAWGDDGLIYVSDVTTGLYVLRLVSEDPGTPPYAHLDLDEGHQH